MAENNFAKALYNFTMDAAAGDAIRHLTDIGYGPTKIHDELTYPAPMEYIGRVMYEYLLNNSVILLKDPAQVTPPEQYEYVLERNEYGRTSYRKVIKTTERLRDDRKYIHVEFGTFKYKYADRLEEFRSMLDGREWDYLMNIPWPLGRFWHIQNECACRIKEVIAKIASDQ